MSIIRLLASQQVGLNEEMFRMDAKKPRGSAKYINVSHQKCEFPERDSSNFNLIKCNICCKWVCEECNNIAIGKVNEISHTSNLTFCNC